jgi:hypothetical protein
MRVSNIRRAYIYSTTKKPARIYYSTIYYNGFADTPPGVNLLIFLKPLFNPLELHLLLHTTVALLPLGRKVST